MVSTEVIVIGILTLLATAAGFVAWSRKSTLSKIDGVSGSVSTVLAGGNHPARLDGGADQGGMQYAGSAFRLMRAQSLSADLWGETR